jgi:hypothetical protein
MTDAPCRRRGQEKLPSLRLVLPLLNEQVADGRKSPEYE